MITRMRELPAAVQELLQWAAFLGFRCTLPSLLALAPDAGLVDIAGRLLTAVGEGLLSTNAENERLLALLQARAHATLEPEELSRVEVRFLHDRVREAACALVPQGERSALHLRIGRFLREHSSEEEIARQLFDIVEHYHSGHALSAPDGARPWHEQHPEEALEVAMLALRAATRALGQCLRRSRALHPLRLGVASRRRLEHRSVLERMRASLRSS
jgi:predicted ATPase